MLTNQELKRMNTPRLLSYFRSIRSKMRDGKFDCPCCGECVWELYQNQESQELKAEYESLAKHANDIKAILSTREHIPR